MSWNLVASGIAGLALVTCASPPSPHAPALATSDDGAVHAPRPAPVELAKTTQFPAVDTGRYGNQIGVVGGYLVAQHYAELAPVSPIEIASFDPITGSRVAAFDPIDSINSEIGGVAREMGFLRVAGDRLVGMTRGTISVFAPETGHRWQTVLYDDAALARLQREHSGLNSMFPAAVAASRDAIYVVVAEAHLRGHDVPQSLELVALARAGGAGAIRWRRRIAAGDSLGSPNGVELRVTDDVAITRWTTDSVARDGRQTIAHAVRDGRELWRTDDDEGQLLTDGSLLVALYPDHWRVLDPKSGVQVARNASPPLSDATLYDGILYGFVRTDSGEQLVAMRARDGSRIWQSDLVPSLRDESSPLIAEDDAIYGCSGGALRLFDRATGTLRFSYGLGTCNLEGVAGRAIITRVGQGPIVAFAPADHPSAPTRVHASGTVTLECAPRAHERVRVGDVVVTTDARGHFDATVPIRGMLRIETAPETELLLSGRRVPYIAYDGRDVDPATSNPIADLDIKLGIACMSHAYETCQPVASACAP